jgi:hypothetical protein
VITYGDSIGSRYRFPALAVPHRFPISTSEKSGAFIGSASVPIGFEGIGSRRRVSDTGRPEPMGAKCLWKRSSRHPPATATPGLCAWDGSPAVFGPFGAGTRTNDPVFAAVSV